MKKLLVLMILPSLLLLSCKKDDNTVTDKETTVSMGTNSLQDVYYSFANGKISSPNRSDWDIAFSVDLMTAAILINEGAGVELYCVGDTNAWNSINENTIETFEPRYNDESNWYAGAFNINNSGGFNFGWGTYYPAVDNVYSDSVYVIKLTDGNYKKLWIREKIGAPDTYLLRWADTDGTRQTDETFSAGPYYDQMNFLHYSIVNHEIVEVEPEKSTWDLLFLQYKTPIPMGPGVVQYPVTGVLINPDAKVVKVTGVDPASAHYSDTTATFTSQADGIGWEWKINDQTTHLYSMAPNTSYFVKLPNAKIYRIYFTDYSGSATGNITFKTKMVE